MEREYEVIRLIQQNASCHIITDCVLGTMLPEYLEEHGMIAKEQLFSYLCQMIKQLGYLQDVRDAKPCRYITQFCMIIKKNGELMLLDLNAKGNQHIVNQMGRGEIRDGFLKKGNSYEAMYSIGKTMQFILAKAIIEPKLTKHEESKLKKIISKCLSDNVKQQYQKISEILFDFPQLKYKKTNKNKKIKWIIVGIIVLLGDGASMFLSDEMEEKRPEAIIDQKKVDFLEIGRTYFLEMEDYRKSMQMFECAEDEIETAENYKELSAYMLGESQKSEEEMESVLSEIEESQKGELTENRMLFRVWAKIEGTTSLEARIRLGEKILSTYEKWKENDVDQRIENEVRTVLAEAYEKTGKEELALEQYRKVSQWNQTEELYRSMVRIAQDIDEQEALRLCEEGIAANPKSKELRLQLIQIQCKDNETTKEMCEESIRKILEECPELAVEETFRKLQEECGIKIEGEVIWVEK